jgi:nucleoside-diphosphate-sugar epimerase
VELAGKRVLITGGTGLIGGCLAERLQTEAQVQVVALARHPEKGRRLAELGVAVVQGDITNPVSLERAVARCDVVFHTAAWVSEKGSKAEIYAVNVAGTENIVRAAELARVQRFVHVSSCAVYGSLQQFNIDENTPVRLTGKPYADSKVLAERVVLQADRLPVVVARPSQVYGPRSYQFSIRPVELIKAGKMALIDGGRFLCKPVYIDNLIDGLILCAQVDVAVGEPINFSDGNPVSWRDFFGAYGRMVGIDSLPSIPFPVAWLVALSSEIRAKIQRRETTFTRRTVQGLRSRNSFSNQKAQDLLGWRPQVDLAEGMQRTEVWLRAEGYI